MLNLLYFAVLMVISPWLLRRSLRTGRYRQNLRAKLTGRNDVPKSGGLTVWFHGVSVGEIHLLTTLVAAYRKRHPMHRIVVSSTTDTGFAEARKHFDNVVVWPLDFTWAVSTALDTIEPNLVVVAEAEMWPNFLKAAQQREIPVVVVNARLSPRSFSRYRRVAALARKLLFNRVSLIATQSRDYTYRFLALGVPQGRVRTTGSIKFDGAMRAAGPNNPLRELLGLSGLCWVAGSTHAPEEKVVLEAFVQLRQEFEDLTLILVPRHPDRFQEVADLLHARGVQYLRRSAIKAQPTRLPPVILLDSVGELGAAWELASVGFVGGTLDGRRGGQSMIEPAGYGVPTVFGPHVWNFRDAARRLVDAGGAVMVQDANEVASEVSRILSDPVKRQAMSFAARQVVAEQQGATERTLDMLDEFLAGDLRRRVA